MREEYQNDDLSEEDSKQQEMKQQKLDAFGKIISKLRDEAVAARRESGFEEIWLEDEDYYNGTDEFNHNQDKFLKPRSDVGGLKKKYVNVDDTRCTAFFNITKQFVDSAAARMGDILLPANEWNFNIAPSPIPQLDELENDETPVLYGSNNEPIQTIGDRARELKKQSAKVVEKSKTRIHDWLVECDYKSESRKVIDGGALVGSGIMKGPFPASKINKKYINGELQIEHVVKPISKRIDHWDFFPDMNCGEDIQEGEYVFERDYLTARQLKELADLPDLGYLPEAINKVLVEGPGKRNESKPDESTKDDDRFSVWYFYGSVSKEDISVLDENCTCEDDDEIGRSVSAVVVLVNDTVIKGYLNPLDNEEFPFDVFVWQRVPGKPFGIGVSRQGRTAQKMINAAGRALMDNMGLSAIPMMAFLRSAVMPADGSWNVRGGKSWYINEESGVRNVNEAIQSIELPTRQKELIGIIELGQKMMEDATGISFLLQGQQGSAPDTVGGMTLLHQNASALLRRCARIYDENLTIPHIKRWYDYLMADPEVPDDEKGDIEIEAVGSSSLVEREIQAMQMPQILQLALNPVFEKSPKKVFEEVLRSFRIDPGKLEMDEEEKQSMAQMQQQTAPQVQVAQIRAETDLQKEQIRQEAGLQKIQVDMDRDRVFAEGVTERNRMAYEKNIADTQLRIQEMELKRELAMLDYANNNQITLEQIKAELARDVMKMNLQKELAYNNDTRKAEQVITPPSEPAGRAPEGEAFQK